MKKLITLLLFLLTITSYGQSELEVKIFKYFNDYRIEHNLNPLKFDKKVLLAAEHHNSYLNNNGYPYNYILDNPHHEKELVYASDRLKKYGITGFLSSAECILYKFRSWKQNDNDLLKTSIESWDGSPSHKRIMLLENIDIGAISILELEDDYFLITLNVVNTHN
ncbi:MAG: hypothetical protein HOA52_04355 [Flavobacteriales bacterium]|jgi:uncharacterized protein YkwD|nr:hypothetical protein [Flavobacteriales bacterium]